MSVHTEATPLLAPLVSPGLSSSSGLNAGASVFTPRPWPTIAPAPPAAAPLAIYVAAPELEPQSPPSVRQLPSLELLSPSPLFKRQPDLERADTESSFSYASQLPTRDTFRRAVYLQFFFSGVLLLASFLSLIFWKHEARWIEVALGAVACLSSESVKEVIFESAGFLGAVEGLALPTILHVVVQELLRLGGIALVVKLLPLDHSPKPDFDPFPAAPIARRPLPPLDTLFISALFFGLGWAAVEIFWASREFYSRSRLYDDLLDSPLDQDLDEDESWVREALAVDVNEEEEEEGPLSGQHAHFPRGEHKYGSTAATSPEAYHHHHEDESRQLSDSAFARFMQPMSAEEQDAEMDARIKKLERDAVESTLGPLYAIPVAIIIVWRIDSIILSLLLTLLISLPFRTTSPSLFAFPLWPTFWSAVGIHVLLALLWVYKTRNLGMAAVSYFSLCVLLAALFAVLAAWGALN